MYNSALFFEQEIQIHIGSNHFASGMFFPATEVCAKLKDLELLEGFRGST